VELTHVPQFFTLNGLLEQARSAEGHSVRFHEGMGWSAGVLQLAPGQHHAEASYERDGLYLVLRGEGVLRIAESRHPVAPGDFWLVPGGTAHRFEDFPGELVVFYLLVSA
jgi:mannose-6-phosphate isomerase-like protein (cupin superfamily)